MTNGGKPQGPNKAATARPCLSKDCHYRTTTEGLFYDKPERNGTIPIQLSNFTAQIVGDVLRDDGAEQERLFEMEAGVNGDTVRFDVLAEKFEQLNWLIPNLGPGAVLYPGKAKEHARAAIQLLSSPGSTRREFTHTGWRRVDDQWIYLHGAGAIGASGIKVRLPEALIRYQLPDPPDQKKAKRAALASLRFLGVAASEQSWPVFAAVWTAVLGELLHSNFVVWIHGPTGQRKTTVAALALSHFGAFGHDSLPANFISTGNATEILAFHTKDALLVVDDYAPSTDVHSAHQRDALAQRIIRGVGDSHGRHRATGSGGLRAARPARALIMATGEELPAGAESLQARILPVEWKPDSVNLERLTLAQNEESSLYPFAMAGFLQWLAPQIESLRTELPARVRQLANRLSGIHGRIADGASKLMCGAELFLRYAVEIGAVSQQDGRQLLEDALSALSQLAEKSAREQEEQKPTAIFFNTLRALFSQKAAYVVDRHTGQSPTDAGLWGWEIQQSSTGQEYPTRRNGADPVGWIDESEGIVYLQTELAYRAVFRFRESQGQRFPVSKRGLGSALKNADMLVRVGSGRNDYFVRVENRREYCWVLSAKELC